MNEVSIIINGVKYDATDASLIEKRNPCGYCDIFDYCLNKCTGEVCYAVGVGKKIFKKSDKKLVEYERIF